MDGRRDTPCRPLTHLLGGHALAIKHHLSFQGSLSTEGLLSGMFFLSSPRCPKNQSHYAQEVAACNKYCSAVAVTS